MKKYSIVFDIRRSLEFQVMKANYLTLVSESTTYEDVVECSQIFVDSVTAMLIEGAKCTQVLSQTEFSDVMHMLTSSKLKLEVDAPSKIDKNYKMLAFINLPTIQLTELPTDKQLVFLSDISECYYIISKNTDLPVPTKEVVWRAARAH